MGWQTAGTCFSSALFGAGIFDDVRTQTSVGVLRAWPWVNGGNGSTHTAVSPALAGVVRVLKVIPDLAPLINAAAGADCYFFRSDGCSSSELRYRFGLRFI